METKGFLPEYTTSVSLLDRQLLHSGVVITKGDSFRMKEAREQKHTEGNPRSKAPCRRDCGQSADIGDQQVEQSLLVDDAPRSLHGRSEIGIPNSWDSVSDQFGQIDQAISCR